MPAYVIQIQADTAGAVREVRNALNSIAREFDGLPRSVSAYRNALVQTNKEVDEAARVHRSLITQQKALTAQNSERIVQSAKIKEAIIAERQNLVGLRNDHAALQAKMQAGSSQSWMTRWTKESEGLATQIKAGNLRLQEHRTNLAALNTTSSEAVTHAQNLTGAINESGKTLQNAKDKATFLKQGISEMNAETDKGTGIMSQFGSAFKGAFVGAVAGFAFSAVIGGIQAIAGAMKDLFVSAIQVSAHFESVRNTMAVFTGSMTAARAELGNIDETARHTTGLRMEDAEIGASNLRALGFSAKTALDLVTGIAKTKTLSPGIDSASVERVIRNLTQLASGSPRIQKDIQEMITAMPILRQNIILTFGSIEQFKAAIKQDATGAIERFGEGLSKVKAASGGFEDAMGHAADAVQTAGRVFAEPMLPVLTDALRDLTKALDNNQSTWSSWGQTVGDTLSGAIVGLKEFLGLADKLDGDKRKELFTKEKIGGKPLMNSSQYDTMEHIEATLKGMGLAIVTGGASFTLDLHRKVGEQNRHVAERQSMADAKSQYDALSDADKNMLPDIQMIGPDGKYVRDYKRTLEAMSEAQALTVQRHLQDITKEENARVMSLTNLKLEAAQENALIKGKYEYQKAVLANHIDYTTKDQQDSYKIQSKNEIDFLEKSRKARLSQFDKEIAKQHEGTDEYNAAVSARAVFAIESEYGLAAKKQEIQKHDKELELQVLEELRQALVEHYSILNTTITQKLSQRTTIIQRELAHQGDAFSDGFDALIKANTLAFREIYNNTSDSYQQQLDNAKLTAEQRANIEDQMYQTLEQLQFDYGQKTQELDDARYAMRISRLESFSKRQQDLMSSKGSVFGGMGAFFNPETYSSGNSKEFNDVYLNQLANLKNKANDLGLATDLAQKKYKELSDTVGASPEELQKAQTAWFNLQYAYQDASMLGQQLEPIMLSATNAISAQADSVSKLGAELSTTSGAYKNFDAIAKQSLENQQKIERDIALSNLTTAKRKLDIMKDQRSSEITSNLSRAQNAVNQSGGDTEAMKLNQEELDKWKKVSDAWANGKGKLDTTELLDASNAVDVLGLALFQLTGQQAVSRLEQHRNSLEGLNEQITELTNHDVGKLNALNDAFDKEGKKATIDDLTEIYRIQYEIAHAAEGSNARISRAYWESAKESTFAWEEAQKTIVKNTIKIADAQVYHQERVQAKLSDWIAGQKTMDDILADSMIGTWEAVFGAMGKGVGKLTERFGIFGDVIKNIIVSLAKMAIMPILSKLFGLPGGGGGGVSTGGGGGGGILSTIFGGLFGGNRANTGGGGTSGIGAMGGSAGSALGAILGGRGLGSSPTVAMGGGANSPLIKAIQSTFSGGLTTGVSGGGFSLRGASGSMLGGILNGSGGITPGIGSSGIGGPLGGFGGILQSNGGILAGSTMPKGSMGMFGGKLSGLGAMLPMLGLGIGSSLGGKSILGQIIGGAGGLLLGGAGAVGLMGTTTGIFAAGTAGVAGSGGMLAGLAPFLTNPFTIAAAGALIVGAILLARNKQRRSDEKTRTQILGDSKTQIQSLIDDVSNDRVDGSQALEQAKEIRTQYMTQVSQLKDKKTRNIAIATVRELDAMIDGSLAQAVQAQRTRQTTNSSLVPEFATGGIIPGVDRGYDNTLIKARPGEVVLTKQHQMMLGGARTMAAIGVPGFAMGGVVPQISGGSSVFNYSPMMSGGDSGDTTIVIVADQKFAEDMAVKGKKKIINLAAENIADRGQIYNTINKVL